MKREKFAMFVVVNDEMDTRQLHLLHDRDANKAEVWRQLIAAVFAQALKEYPNLYSNCSGMED